MTMEEEESAECNKQKRLVQAENNEAHVHKDHDHDSLLQEQVQETTTSSLVAQTRALTLSDDEHNNTIHNSKVDTIVCDAGYGLPLEARPRKEKICAIAKQLYNFLKWQQKAFVASVEINNNNNSRHSKARIQVVGCDAETSACLQDRLTELWKKDAIATETDRDALPSHVDFVSQDLETYLSTCTLVDSHHHHNEKQKVIYLSPDAEKVMNPSCARPASTVVVGLLIDRRIQPNRSKRRASALGLQSARLPLEDLAMQHVDKREPLNVDAVLHVMQAWWWNCDAAAAAATNTTCSAATTATTETKEHFRSALSNAMECHVQRHPNRPVHKSIIM